MQAGSGAYTIDFAFPEPDPPRRLGPRVSLDAADLARPCGPNEGLFADRPLLALVLHINREVIHHGAEIALLRDVYASRAPSAD